MKIKWLQKNHEIYISDVILLLIVDRTIKSRWYSWIFPTRRFVAVQNGRIFIGIGIWLNWIFPTWLVIYDKKKRKCKGALKLNHSSRILSLSIHCNSIEHCSNGGDSIFLSLWRYWFYLNILLWNSKNEKVITSKDKKRVRRLIASCIPICAKREKDQIQVNSYLFVLRLSYV